MMQVLVEHRGEKKEVSEGEWRGALDEMVGRLGPWEPGVSKVTRLEAVAVAVEPQAAPVVSVAPAVTKPVSEFGAGKQVVDAEAIQRNEATQVQLRAAGFEVGRDRQLYDTGTRMAQVGYDTQRERAAEHANKQPAREVAAQLIERIESEGRREVEVSAKDFGKLLSMNGALRFDGLKLREQAVRGLLSGRLRSTALTHVMGLRERISDKDASEGQKAQDKAQLLHILKEECERFGDVKLKLRTRQGLGDVFAVVSPEYAVADAPSVLPQVLNALPHDAKATFAYDPTTTAWELRANIFTPTAVDEQAVGEAFEGFTSFGSRDNGTRGLDGGGGVLMLACLNAGVYTAETKASKRRHIGRILIDIPAMVREAMRAIHVLCEAWGTARTDTLSLPIDDKDKLVPLEDVIPGFYRHMLTDRRGELLGVLPGRTTTHVDGLAKAYGSERRDQKLIVRSDLAQGWTRYIQTQPAPVRRDAEKAIGAWLVEREPVRFVAAA